MVIETQTYSQWRQILRCLTGREAQVIIHRFGFLENTPKTLDEIGQLIGITRERVRQIESFALRKLRREAALAGAKSGDYL